MDTNKLISLTLERLREFVLEYINSNISDEKLTIKSNKYNLFDINYNGYSYLLQYYFAGANQNQFPYLLLGIVKGYIIEGGIDLEHPASIVSTERFTINFLEADKISFTDQSSKKVFDNFEDFVNPWLIEISNTRKLK